MRYQIPIIVFVLSVLPVSIQAKTLLILGDSLSAAYGIPVEKGWVSLLQQRIIRQNLSYKVINASISGETTLGARTRIKRLLAQHTPSLVMVELGGNDGLRGFALSEIEQNLTHIVTTIKESGADIILVPMQLPPNYGAVYNERFISLYKSVAKQTGANLSNFILQDIARNPDLMQSDGIHPVELAQPKMLDNVWPSLQTLMQ